MGDDDYDVNDVLPTDRPLMTHEDSAGFNTQRRLIDGDQIYNDDDYDDMEFSNQVAKLEYDPKRLANMADNLDETLRTPSNRKDSVSKDSGAIKRGSGNQMSDKKVDEDQELSE